MDGLSTRMVLKRKYVAEVDWVTNIFWVSQKKQVAEEDWTSNMCTKVSHEDNTLQNPKVPVSKSMTCYNINMNEWTK